MKNDPASFSHFFFRAMKQPKKIQWAFGILPCQDSLEMTWISLCQFYVFHSTAKYIKESSWRAFHFDCSAEFLHGDDMPIFSQLSFHVTRACWSHKFENGWGKTKTGICWPNFCLQQCTRPCTVVIITNLARCFAPPATVSNPIFDHLHELSRIIPARINILSHVHTFGPTSSTTGFV